MIKLYTFPPACGLRNVSPFCLKVEMALSYLEIPFEIVEISDPRKAPKGKLPYVDIDGQIRWFSANLSPFYREGTFAGSVAVSREITELKRVEELLREALLQSAAIFLTRGTLLYTADKEDTFIRQVLRWLPRLFYPLFISADDRWAPDNHKDYRWYPVAFPVPGYSAVTPGKTI